MADPTFTFEVDQYGTFSFVPKDDWAYRHTDKVTIQTRTGPFRLRVVPKGAAILYRDPLGSPITVREPDDEGMWKVTAAVNDGLTDGERRALRIANAQAGQELGFIAQYFYDIEVTRQDGRVFRSQEHNGEHGC